MACGTCGCDDCSCDFELSEMVNEDRSTCTVCTGDCRDNIWFQAKAPGFPGRCILDEITYEDVYDVLQRVPGAAEHLMRITSDPRLLTLARETKLLTSEIAESEAVAKKINGGAGPYYTVLKGNTGGGF